MPGKRRPVQRLTEGVMLRPWDSSSRWCCWPLGGSRSGRGSAWRCWSRCWCRPPGGGCGRTAGCSAAWSLLVAAATAVVVLLPDGRLPIPPGGGLLVTSSYDGHAVEPSRSSSTCPSTRGWPANGGSTMHDDAWATDSYQGPGPLGKDPEVTTSWFGLEECATLAFDPDGRLVALCGNRTGPVMHVLDPETMRPLETLDLPDREKSDKRPWEDLCGGAYFYLDAQARAVVATTDRRVLTVDSDELDVRRRGRPRRRRAGRRLPGRAAARLGGQHLVRHPGRPGRRGRRHRRPHAAATWPVRSPTRSPPTTPASTW